MPYHIILSSLSLLLLFTTTTQATLVIADFNDNTVGQLSNFTAGAGQAGGSGFDPNANNTWGNTGTINAISGDLAAPAGTGYAITQSGPGVSAQGTFASGRQTTRALSSTLTGDVWFSFLLNQPTTNSRGGITFNRNASSPGDPRIVATGTDLRLGLQTIQAPGAGANGIFTLGQDALVLGRLTINSLGNEILDVWVDPVLTSGPGGLGAPHNSWTEQSALLDAGITRLGVQSYSSDTQGGIIDSLRVADGPTAFTDVTGVTGVAIPEPGTSVLLALGIAATTLRRRRH